MRKALTCLAGCVAALCLSLSLAPAPVRADLTISAAPSLVELTATPGGTGSQAITVTNAGSEKFSVDASVTYYKSGEASRSAAAWLRLEPGSFELGPGQSRAVNVTVSVPSTAESGGRYAAVAFRTGAKAVEGSAVGVAAQVEVPFLVTVKGAGSIAKQGKIDSLVPVLESNGELGFRAVMANQGNVHLYARGSIGVSDDSGRSLGQMELRDSTAILPGTTETLQTDRTIQFRDGATYRANAQVLLAEGGSLGTAQTQFAATAQASIDNVTARAASQTEVDALLLLKNAGSLAMSPRVLMAVRGDDGKVVGVLSSNQPSLLWPGQTAEVRGRYPGKLPAGNYTLVARAEYGGTAVQRETPLLVSGSATKPDSSISVSSWAEGSGNKKEVAGSLPIDPIPLRGGAVQAGWDVPMNPVLLVAVFASVAVAGMAFRRRGRSTVRPGGSRLALPCPPIPGLRILAQLGANRRAARLRRAAPELLPPPPILFLPPPRDEQRALAHDGNWNGYGRDDLAPRYDRPALSAHSIPTMSGGVSEPASHGLHAGPGGASLEPLSRAPLARAVAEKAASVASRAQSAAERGDIVTADRLSRQAIKLDPRNIDAWLCLATTCVDRNSARLCLEAVLLLDPGNSLAKQAVASLDIGRNLGEQPDLFSGRVRP